MQHSNSLILILSEIKINLLGTNPTKWWNTLKKFVG